MCTEVNLTDYMRGFEEGSFCNEIVQITKSSNNPNIFS